MSILETKGLTFTYGIGTPFEKTAMQDVSVAFEPGELVGVIGHTGSGKSTLMQHLNGLMKPTAGQVLLDGTDIWEQPKRIRDVRFRVGMVFQYPEQQLFAETVFDDNTTSSETKATLQTTAEVSIPNTFISNPFNRNYSPVFARFTENHANIMIGEKFFNIF